MFASFESPGRLSAFTEAMKTREGGFSGGGADIPFAGTDHWCRATPPTHFADRAAAERLLGIDFLQIQKRNDRTRRERRCGRSGARPDRFGLNYENGWPVGNIQPGTTIASARHDPAPPWDDDRAQRCRSSPGEIDSRQPFGCGSIGRMGFVASLGHQ